MISSIFPFKRFSFFNEKIFDSFSEKEIKIIEQNSIRINLKKGQVLFHENTIPTGIHLIKSGKVKMYITNIMNNKEHIFLLSKENEILGYTDLLSKENYSYSTACLVDSEFYLIPKKIICKLIKETPKVLSTLIKCLCHQYGVFIVKSQLLAQYSVRERVAISLLKLDAFYKQERGILISRKDHSNLIGTSVESLVRVLHDFKKEEIILISEGHKIEVLNTKKLIEVSNFI